jgi:hypothetical protein
MIALLAALALAAPQPGDLKTFKDWVAGCDNGLTCQADGLMPEEDYDAATIAVKRDAQPEAIPEIWFRLSEGKPADIVIDGRAMHVRLTARGDSFEIARPDSMRLATALAHADKVEIVDSTGKQIVPLSAQGAAAALLYMDDRQHRIGTVTAIVRKGDAPASSMPAPPAIPVVLTAVPSNRPPTKLSDAEIRKIRGEDACDDPAREEEPEYIRLDAASTLALVPEVCASGAYNYFFVPMIVGNDGKARDARFDDAGAEEGGTFNTSWDARTRTLETGMKGRGLGDCGGWSSYAWDGERFRLIQLNVMSECRGSIDFITVWRARAVERR